MGPFSYNIDTTYCVHAVSDFIQYTLNEAARCLDLLAFYLGSVYRLIIVLVNQLSGLSDRLRCSLYEILSGEFDR